MTVGDHVLADLLANSALLFCCDHDLCAEVVMRPTELTISSRRTFTRLVLSAVALKLFLVFSIVLPATATLCCRWASITLILVAQNNSN
ncbi:MAG: hypothetical protein CMK99_23055 [Pseudomonas sp.]|nr:hypothetical protein [Pseudomonas sp.]HBS80616.1 hypothetical protein [Pseudomonas sp.]